MIFHSTLYDGALERAGIEAQTPVFSITADLLCQKLASKMVRNKLLDDWKKGCGRSAEFGVKFQSAAPSLPEITAVPDMLVCKVFDSNTLVIPTDIRQRFLQDPCRSKEWKAILAEFDKAHGPHIAATTAPEVAATQAVEASNESLQWSEVFVDSPKTVSDLESKFQVAATFALSSGNLVAKIVEGPHIYICAPAAAGNFDTATPIFAHGGGSWLLDAKATKALQDIFFVILMLFFIVDVIVACTLWMLILMVVSETVVRFFVVSFF